MAVRLGGILPLLDRFVAAGFPTDSWKMPDGQMAWFDFGEGVMAFHLGAVRRTGRDRKLYGGEIQTQTAVAVARAEAMGVEVIMPRNRNPPDGDGGPNHWEIWLRDPDGYKVVLASPDGTADGEWRPHPTQGE